LYNSALIMGSATGYQLYQITRLKHLTANRKVAASNPQGDTFKSMIETESYNCS